MVKAALVVALVGLLVGGGWAAAEPGDPVEVEQPGLVTAVAECDDGKASVIVYVDDDRDPPLKVRLDRLRPETSTQIKDTVLDEEHLVHTVSFEPVAAGDYNVHVEGLDGAADDVPVLVKPCAELKPSDELLKVEVACKAGWGFATFIVSNPKTGTVASYDLAVNGIPAHVIELSGGLFLRITENAYDDGPSKARLTGDGVDVTKQFTVKCASGHAPRLEVSTSCESGTGRVMVEVRNPNRAQVDYDVILKVDHKSGSVKNLTVGGGQRGTVTFEDVPAGEHRVRVVGKKDKTEAASVAKVVCKPATTPTTTTTTTTPAPQGRPGGELANTGTSVGGLLGVGALALATGGALLMIVRRRRAHQD